MLLNCETYQFVCVLFNLICCVYTPVHQKNQLGSSAGSRRELFHHQTSLWKIPNSVRRGDASCILRDAAGLEK